MKRALALIVFLLASISPIAVAAFPQEIIPGLKIMEHGYIEVDGYTIEIMCQDINSVMTAQTTAGAILPHTGFPKASSTSYELNADFKLKNGSIFMLDEGITKVDEESAWFEATMTSGGVKLNSLALRVIMPEDMMKGRSILIDGKEIVMPLQPDKDLLFNGDLKEKAVIPTAAGNLFIEGNTKVLVYDVRKWNVKRFELRILFNPSYGVITSSSIKVRMGYVSFGNIELHTNNALQESGHSAERIVPEAFKEVLGVKLDPPPTDAGLVNIPGEVSLFDIGWYRAGYRIDGRAITWLPVGWTGGNSAFGIMGDSSSGTTFEPGLLEGNRRAAFIQVPYCKGPGNFYLDYRLKLPESPRLRLDTSLALRPKAVGYSDGVVLRVYVNGQKSLELENKSAEWMDGSVDLSNYRGEEIHLRLELDPGPGRNTGWDWALVGEPRLVATESMGKSQVFDGDTVGLEARGRNTEMAILIDRERFGEVDLLGLLNDPNVGVMPSTSGNFTNKVLQEGSNYIFVYEGSDGRLDYVLDPRVGWPGKVTIWYYDRSGRKYLVGDAFVGAGPVFADGASFEVSFLESSHNGDVVSLMHDFKADRAGMRLASCISIKGKTLKVEVQQVGIADGVVSEFNAGQIAMPIRKRVCVPYLFDQEIFYAGDVGVFVACYLDWTVSSSSGLYPRKAEYRSMTNGGRRPVRESVCLTVSPHLGEVLPNIPNPPSPERSALASRIVADIWSGSFPENQSRIELLKSYGVRDLAIIYHNWQHQGFDNAYPNVLPANPRLGGDEALKSLIDVAKGAGYLFSLHENYVDFYPNAESFNPEDIALEPSGEWRKAYFNSYANEGKGIQSYALKPIARLKYGKEFSPKIQESYHTNASFLDVHSATQPWFHMDFDASNPKAALISDVIENTRELFRFVRNTHGGPLLGEGGYHYYWAGAIDGVAPSLRLQGGEHAPWLVDFDLLKLHPQMVNHGMGYQERWLESGYSGDWGRYIPPQYKLDKYRAMELAFGHAGFIANQIWQLVDVTPSLVLQEYFLVQPIQARYAVANPVSILYEVNGKFLDASSVIRAGASFERVVIKYDSGLELWVNGNPDTDWKIEGMTIPPYGFLAKAPGLFAYTARDAQGIIGDMALADGQLYVNSRTAGYMPPWDLDYRRHMNDNSMPVDFGPVITDGSIVVRADEKSQGLIIYPIPRHHEFTVKLRVEELVKALRASRANGLESEPVLSMEAKKLSLVGFDINGTAIVDVPFDIDGNIVTFTHTSEDVAYYRFG